jgi:hypothetical protein
MFTTLRHRIDSYASASVHRDFEDVIEKSNLAIACMDFEAFIDGGVDVFELLCKTKTKWAELVISGEVEPNADVDECFWVWLKNWHQRSQAALGQLEQFERLEFDVDYAAEFRSAILAAERMLGNSDITDDELDGLVG